MNFKCQMSNASNASQTSHSGLLEHHITTCSHVRFFPCSHVPAFRILHVRFPSCPAENHGGESSNPFANENHRNTFCSLKITARIISIHFIHLTIIVQLSRGWNRRVETSNLEPALWQRPSQRLSTDRS